MNTHTTSLTIDLDAFAAAQLTTMARRMGITRETLVRRALENMVRECLDMPSWAQWEYLQRFCEKPPARQGDLFNPQPPKEQ